MSSLVADTVVCQTCGAMGGPPQSFCHRCGTPRAAHTVPPPGAVYGPDSPSPRLARPGLGGAFGQRSAAPIARRVGALGVDLVLLAGVGVAAWLLAPPFLAGAVVADWLLLQWIWSARLGLTCGNFLFQIEMTTARAPRPPGAWRVAACSLVLSAAIALGFVGLWVTAISGRWDPTGQGQTWHDRLTGTRVLLRPPRQQATRRHHGIQPSAPGVFIPPLVTAPEQSGRRDHLAAQSAPVESGLGSSTGLDPVSAAATLATSAAATPSAVGPTRSATTAPDGDAVVPIPAPPPRPHQATIIFDTGQRVLLSLPGVATLGRNPAPPPPGSDPIQVIRVKDPDSTVSKTHLRLEFDDQTVTVIDLGSTNGSAIVLSPTEEVPLPSHQARMAPHGTTIRLGDRTFITRLS